MKDLEQSNSETESGGWLPGTGGGAQGAVFNGDSVSVWDKGSENGWR